MLVGQIYRGCYKDDADGLGVAEERWQRMLTHKAKPIDVNSRSNGDGQGEGEGGYLDSRKGGFDYKVRRSEGGG